MTEALEMRLKKERQTILCFFVSRPKEPFVYQHVRWICMDLTFRYKEGKKPYSLLFHTKMISIAEGKQELGPPPGSVDCS